MKILVDGDIIVFRAGFACEKSAYFITHDGKPLRFQYKKELDAYFANNGLVGTKYEKDVELEPVQNALHTTGLMLDSILEDLQGNRDDMQIYLSGPNNFRYGIATIKPYKGNRDAAHRPTHEHAIKDYLVERWGAVFTDGEEADDALGIEQYTSWEQGIETCIVSLDKDLHMIPGHHYNFAKREAKIIGMEEADKNFWSQMITGDTTDNIPGVPGLGPAAAKKILADDNYIQRVAEAYRRAYQEDWRGAMLEMGRLLWIRRSPNGMWQLPLEIT
jgi:hypothetical protein